jgi:HEAT repeat protein
MFLGLACAAVPSMRHENRWVRWVPTGILVVLYPHVKGPDNAFLIGLLDRLQTTAATPPGRSIPRWQQASLAQRAARVLDENDSRPDCRTALELLTCCGDSAAVAVPQLGQIAGSAPQSESWRAMQIMYHLGPLAQAALPELMSIAKDQARDTNTRAFAIHAIAAMGEEARPAIPLLVRAIETPGACHRPSVIDALVRCGATEALPALVHIMETDPYSDGPVAAWAAGELGPDRETTAALLQALTGARFELEQAALKALRRHPEALGTVVGWCAADARHPDEARRYRAVRALALLGPDAAPAAPALITLLRDPSSLVRFNAVIALEAVGGRSQSTLDALKAVANEDSDEQIRFCAARATIALTSAGGR